MAGIFDGLEKLINEHGSAKILGERLALARDKYDALEKKLLECQQENTSLLQRLKKLEGENEKLKQIADRNSNHPADFDETTHRVLKVFFDQAGDVSAEQVAGHIRIDRPLFEYHLDLLREAGFIIQTTVGRPPMFSITPSGRKYVVKNSI